MRLLIVDPVISTSSPSMKGVVRALPALRAAGIEIEAWGAVFDADLPISKQVRIPLLRLPVINFYLFTACVMLRSWWLYSVLCKPRPDVIYTIAWYLPQCDIVHVHFSPWDWLHRQRVLGIRSLRDLVERAATWLSRCWANFFLSITSASKVISVSRSVADDVSQAAPDLPVFVLPNSYDPARFNTQASKQHRAAARAELGFSDKETVFIFTSMGHYRRKGFFLAVQTLKLLRAQGHAARLHVVGGQPATLAKLQAELDQQQPDWRNWITFSGLVNDVERHYAASDALLFPSYSEAFALVEIEAAACGLPLFLTHHHGSEMSLVDGQNGRYIDFDPNAAASVLAEFITGAWVPQPTPLRDALDSESYAQRLIQEFQSVCHQPATAAVIHHA